LYLCPEQAVSTACVRELENLEYIF